MAGGVLLHPVLTPPHEAWRLVEEDLRVVVGESDGDLSMAELAAAVFGGRAMLWLVLGGSDERLVGCVVTELVSRPGRLWANIVAIRVRRRGAFPEVLRHLAEWAGGIGATLCGESRRPGMARRLEAQGWKPRFVQYVAP